MTIERSTKIWQNIDIEERMINKNEQATNMNRIKKLSTWKFLILGGRVTFQSLMPSLNLSKDVESTIDAPFGSSFIENYVFGMEHLTVTQDDPSRRVHDPFWTCWLDKEFFFFFEIIFNLRQQRLATQFKLYKHVIDDQMDSSLCVDKRFSVKWVQKTENTCLCVSF